MEIEKIQKYFEILEKRKNFSERKYLSTELLDRLGIKKYRKLIEENDDVIFNGECGFKLKEETYEEIRKILSEVYKDAYDLEDEEEKEMFYEHIDSFFDNEKFLKVWRLSFEDIILEECVETWKPSVRHSYLNKDLVCHRDAHSPLPMFPLLKSSSLKITTFQKEYKGPRTKRRYSYC